MTEINPQASALRWLLEMEIVSDPNVFNGLILNLFRISKKIKDIEIVTDTRDKKLLIYVDLQLNRWFKDRQKERIQHMIENIVSDALPSYERRVVFDRNILEKALELVSKKNEQA